ncbi:O-acyltransferase like protein-like [Pecten maximus]|uniref:O-acyltransferase like protein-like n=1 Tax=Pecten maximus TaxID=6579 RepID=UPI0014590D2D|nr:O-acyltransferase like protein-like [Pecten maximus]
MENMSCSSFVSVIAVCIVALFPQNSVSIIDGHNLSHAEKAAFIAEYFIQHEVESHYVFESVISSRDLAQHISSGNKTSATPELLDALSSYILVSLPVFLRNQIVQGIVEVFADEAGNAYQRTNLKLDSSQTFSNDDIRLICSEFDYVRALTRSITTAKPLIQQYRQENDSTVYIILLNKAIEMTAYIISTPSFQTVMDIVVDELSQGFMKSGLPERIAKEGTGFLNDILAIVKTVIESSNIQRLISRSYIASKPDLDSLYNGDTFFLYATLMSAIFTQEEAAGNIIFQIIEADFLKTYNEKYNGDIEYLLNDPFNTYGNVLKEMDLAATVLPLLGSGGARTMLPYNSSIEQDKISEVCYDDTMDFIDAVIGQKEWALQLLDAQGKVPSGLLDGNWNFLGAMDQCLDIKPDMKSNEVIGNTRRPAGTRFCRVVIPFIQNLTEEEIYSRVTWGVCVPDTCTGSDVYGILKLDAFGNYTEALGYVECITESDLAQDLPAIITLIVIGFIVLLMISGSLYVAMETRGFISNNHETVNREVDIASKDEYTKDNDADLKRNENDDNNCKRNGTNLSEHYVQYSECNKPVLNIPPNNDEVQPNAAANGNDSTTHAMPNANVQHKRKKEGVLISIIKAFSVQINIPKILSTNTASGTVRCLHGIRFVTITWVILIHSYAFGIIHNHSQVWYLANPLVILTLQQRFSFHGVMAANSAVDTFFMMSGMLLSYTQLKNMQKLKAKLTGSNVAQYVFHYFFHRIWRLTPLYVMVLVIHATLTEHISSGPFLPSVFQFRNSCKKNWWTNMLYINNIVHQEEQCMGWSWYLANDMQFYIVSLVILFLMMLKMQIGILVSVMLLLVGMVNSGLNRYEIQGTQLTNFDSDSNYWRDIYIAPWCRVGAYMVGILFGVFLQKQPRKPFNKLIGFAGWTIATAVALTLKYSLYSFNREGGEPWSKLQYAIYEAFDRPVWAMCVCWVVFACHNYMGGPVDSLLSWRGLVPLSRLTFAAYLIHPVVMIIQGSSRFATHYLSDYSMIYLNLGHITVSFMAAFVLSLALESPFITLEKLLV